ncbi:MAG: hypothetical protein FWD15_01365 [Alphaproteobacteria bacterium]|nr:hypothetical protein [Alphaproteobacteria bacterium]
MKATHKTPVAPANESQSSDLGASIIGGLLLLATILTMGAFIVDGFREHMQSTKLNATANSKTR